MNRKPFSTITLDKYGRDNLFNNPAVNAEVFDRIDTIFIGPLLSKEYIIKPFNIKLNKFVEGDPHTLLSNQNVYYVRIPKGVKRDPETSDAPWIASFQGYRRAMRWLKEPSDMINQYACWVGFDPSHLKQLLHYPLSVVLPLFKKIKIWCHSHFDDYGAACRYYVDLDSISGIPPQSLRTLGDDPHKWLTKLVKSEYGVKFWFTQFLKTFSNMANQLPKAILSLYQFTVSRWLWVTPGATKFSKLMLDDELIKTKFAAAVSLTDAELWQLVIDAINGHQPIGVFVKGDEASFKRRLIANVPLGGYIIAAYVRYLIESFLGKHPAFEKLSPTFEDKIDVINLLREGRLCYPLDESAYDYHVTRESWLGFIEFLKFSFPNNQGVLFFERYFNVAVWEFNGQTGRWLKGMPSGLALTTMVNSWMNYIKQTTIINSEIHWACGDDVLTFPFDKDLTLKDIEEAYLRFGSEANASKNWCSVRFGEYLKTLYGRYGTTGYPARIFGSLLYTQDLSFRRPDEKLYELVDLWKQLFDRLGLPMDERMVCRDLANAISTKVRGFNARMAMAWLHSPKIHGGFGKLPYNNFTFTWKLPDKKVSEYRNSRYRLPKVISYYGDIELIVGRYNYKPTTFKNGPAYHLPPIENEDEWVRRLNREDLPDRGPYTDMVLDTIPLPVIDFVSVANMSMLAQQFEYNIYPNLRGKWNSIANKLITASLSLVSLVSSLMTNHKLHILV